MVLCDIGNTTFHFQTKNNDFKLFHYETLPQFNKQIYFISVNKNATKKLLMHYPTAINLEKYIKFDTLYKGMGIDRQLVCSNIINDIVVVDAGSAITVDIIQNKQHQGGFILSGLYAMQKTYCTISTELDFKFNTKVSLDKLPLNTNDAISYAIIQSIVQSIKSVAVNKEIIFTGGDGLFLSKYFTNATYNKYLIFDNIKLLLDKMNLIKN
jgi:type III pantothenate kinase